MTFKEFIEKYDYSGSIILLEGKRNVLQEDIPKLISLGEQLAKETKHCKFRSGNAPGADYFFAEGVCNIDRQRLEVIIPFNGHRKTFNKAASTISLDNINLKNEFEVVKQSKENKKTHRLISLFVAGARDGISIKSSFIIRDTIKVIGTKSGVIATKVALFYDDLNNPGLGGTGHTISVCRKNNIAFVDQTQWFEWLQNT